MEVVVASRNAKKLGEMQALLAPLAWHLHSIAEFTAETVEENAPTFAGNALLKARHAARISGMPAIADDSGIEVDALNRAPGVLSARFAGAKSNDSANNQKLLRELKGIPDDRRGARYWCVMVYLRDAEDATPLIAQAQWRGMIAHNPRGANGFGYDPLFYVAESKCTAAELDPAAKNKVSHRGKAAKHLYSLIHDAGIHG